jgi:hypothetical protein
MKKIKQLIFLSAFLILIAGCDKDFESINTNPYAITTIDQGLVFAGSQRVTLGNGWESESTVIQQFVNPYNLGATRAFNLNADIDNFQNSSWGSYTGPVRAFTQILFNLKGTTTQVNLQSMVRIWRVYVFMDIVDHYGNVPYFKTGLAALEGPTAFFPAYDDASAIYDDLYAELKDAISKLDPAGDYVSADLFFGAKGFTPNTTAATQIPKWKKLGNSILLRMGMRYSKANPAKAQAMVNEAFTGGVMTSNTDNVFVIYDGTNFTNGANGGLINNNPYYYYAAEPFVNQLKSTNDPRARFMVATFADPQKPLNDAAPVTTLASQFGVPVGITDADLAKTSLGYRGPRAGGLNYAQMNVNVAASTLAPTFWITYAQTSLLLAEAAKRGWITGGDAAAKGYYEAAVRADMNVYTTILSKTKPSNTLVVNPPATTVAEQDAYLAQAGVLYDPANAIQQINTQYWLASYLMSAEAWANFRRTGFPVLIRNKYNDNLLANGGDGFVHRFTYPDAELPKNKVNYQDAVAKLVGGVDDLINRVFWDTK